MLWQTSPPISPRSPLFNLGWYQIHQLPVTHSYMYWFQRIPAFGMWYKEEVKLEAICFAVHCQGNIINILLIRNEGAWLIILDLCNLNHIKVVMHNILYMWISTCLCNRRSMNSDDLCDWHCQWWSPVSHRCWLYMPVRLTLQWPPHANYSSQREDKQETDCSSAWPCCPLQQLLCSTIIICLSSLGHIHSPLSPPSYSQINNVWPWLPLKI